MPDFTLNESAAAIHEMYCSFLAAGFNEEHAFQLTRDAFRITLAGGE